MREHPIPQDITGYRFHLVGSMTLKQFAEILLGCLIAFIIYKTGLPGIIRWPGMLLFAGTGFMAAFVPIEERPLDHWIVTFLKVLFKPTKFFWSKEPKIPEAFTYEAEEPNPQFESSLDLSPARKNKIYQYLQSIDRPNEGQDAYDAAEQQRVDQLLVGFSQVQVSSEPSRGKVKPNLKVRVRDMKNLTVPTEAQISQSPSLGENQMANAARPISQNPSSTTNENEEMVSDQSLEPESRDQNQQQQQPPQEKKPQTIVNTLPPPPNSLPNQISGILMTQNEELIGEAVIEIRDSDGKTVTAVKSNSLGQFVVTRQLPNGEYALNIKTADHQFEPVAVALSGKILGALEIVAS